MDAPTKILNTHRTDTPHHNTTQHNTTTTTQRGIPHRVVLGKGGPSQGGPWPKKQDMSNKLSRRAAPLAKVFLGSRMVRKGLGTKRFDQKKLSGPRVGVGQKWCGKNIPKITKKFEKYLSQTKKSKKIKNQQQNQKIEKMLKERKSNQNIAQTTINKIKKNQKIFAFSYSFSSFFLQHFYYYFYFFRNLCDVLGFWSTKKILYPEKNILYPEKSF